ncbi:Nucleolar protein 14 Nucleolar complex protein 14 [Channa argus]|uniref:Nucleolar protein 14 Nucleolar complex protein 14 n=1 Tax=Channa argus TaxID=215402 RepID=A0A6G1QHP6_CHAAH|nr:Nucleolar protein 14 Nucleolar complex protein 14 [Channa argus]
MRRRREMESEPGKKKVTLTLTLSKKARMRRKPKDKQTSAKEKSLSKEKVKAQQDAAKAEVPYIYNGNYIHICIGKKDFAFALSFLVSFIELYALCQMFPEAASRSMQSIIGEAGHSMKEAFEVKGHARLEYGKKCVSTREEREKEQRKHKYKKDHKGALREIGNY